MGKNVMLEFLWRGKLRVILGTLFIVFGLLSSAACFLVYYYLSTKPTILQEINETGLIACAVLGVIITALLLLFSFFLLRQISKFIDELRQSIEQITAGNFGISCQPSYFAELDQLLESFNAMSHYLAVTYQKLANQINTLEKQNEQAQAAHQSLVKNNLKLKELIMQDPLTGVFNRRYLMQQLYRQVNFSIRYKQPMAVLFIDIDYFKDINDTYGHQVGDEILREFVRLLMLAIRSTDILTRYGGEEFIILAPQTDLDNATRLAERIRETIAANAFRTNKGTVHFTVSVGVSTFKGEETKEPEAIVEKLLNLADRRCYEAKAKGRNQVNIMCIEETVDKFFA